MKFRRFIDGLILAMFSVNAFAFTECVRGPIGAAAISTKPGATNPYVYVTFQDGGSSIGAYENQLTKGQMDGFMSVVLTAQARGVNLKVRYPEDNMTCPPAAGTGARFDHLLIWIID